MASEDDSFYKYFVNTSVIDKLWSELEFLNISPEFKDLVTRMLEFREEARLTLADIMAHPWMKGRIATHPEVLEEIAQKENALKKSQSETTSS
jgi:serine/threonine protein kinase